MGRKNREYLSPKQPEIQDLEIRLSDKFKKEDYEFGIVPYILHEIHHGTELCQSGKNRDEAYFMRIDSDITNLMSKIGINIEMRDTVTKEELFNQFVEAASKNNSFKGFTSTTTGHYEIFTNETYLEKFELVYFIHLKLKDLFKKENKKSQSYEEAAALMTKPELDYYY